MTTRTTKWWNASAPALLGGAMVGVAVAAFSLAAGAEGPPTKRFDLSSFRRPTTLPVPPDNMATPEQIALGAALFSDTRLSRDGTQACATCHNPALSFTDGESRGQGIARKTLRRHTPTLWNLAWGDTFFWDGRAGSLEDQARGPIEHPLEMDMRLADAVERLKSDSETVKSFDSAYGAGSLTEANVLKALAAYERTLVSPKTRFDRWVEGDETALTADEIKGFELFNGRAGCSKCHSSWRFTDEAFHDIGLPESTDKGRGEATGLARMNNAFKTPTLRELVWTAPYMHDGSLASIDGVNDHYFGGVENRPTISKDVPLITPVFTSERRQLTAFLRTLSSETPPQPDTSLEPVVLQRHQPRPIEASEIGLRLVEAGPITVRRSRGETLTIRNDDDRTHALYVDDPKIEVSPDPQEPGASMTLSFGEAGTYTVACHIHPRTRIVVEVVDKDASAPATAPVDRQ